MSDAKVSPWNLISQKQPYFRDGLVSEISYFTFILRFLHNRKM